MIRGRLAALVRSAIGPPPVDDEATKDAAEVAKLKAETRKLAAEAATAEATARVAQLTKWDQAQQEESLRQNNVAYLGLILIGVYLVQPFLTAGSLDLSAKICVVAFAVAIPLLAALVMLNRQETFRHRASPSVSVTITKVVAQGSAFVGLVAGFWHIVWVAGVGVLIAALAGMFVHSAGYMRLEQDQ